MGIIKEETNDVSRFLSIAYSWWPEKLKLIKRVFLFSWRKPMCPINCVVKWLLLSVHLHLDNCLGRLWFDQQQTNSLKLFNAFWHFSSFFCWNLFDTLRFLETFIAYLIEIVFEISRIGYKTMKLGPLKIGRVC